MRLFAFFTASLVLFGLSPAMGIAAGDDEPEIKASAPVKVIGPESDLPLPRYVSMKAEEGNVRRGPSLTHRVDWVFKREDMPLQVTAEYGNWRRVRDIDGAGGWMHYTLLSGVRTVIVQKDYTPFRSRPQVGADPNAYAEQGVVAFLGDCKPDWCEVNSGGQSGWVLKSEIWGVEDDEIRD
jgi:SH3-like domain-containing protein